jgi:transcriptional regulator with XRE-family HTH domain
VTIGETLAKARRRARLTVTQVSEQTGISEMIITSIERDNYLACGSDFDARGDIRSIARAVGADPEPLIWKYDAARLGPQAITDDVTEPVTPIRIHKRRRLNWTAALGLALVVGLGFAAYYFLAGSRHAASAAPSARAHPVTHRHAGQGTHAPQTPKTSTPGAVPVRMLTPASAAAFGPSGAGQGDNSDLAHLAIDADPATAWHTDWYTSAHFGNLYPGTGLLVDMGRPVTITAAQIQLGRAHGAGFQLRVGAAPALADLPPVAHAANASGVVRLQLATPAHGRYLLIWFTSLPPGPAGTFQASVYNLRLEGRA